VINQRKKNEFIKFPDSKKKDFLTQAIRERAFKQERERFNHLSSCEKCSSCRKNKHFN
jgi:hypothetical protein